MFFYMLVGVPGTGKTTFVRNFIDAYRYDGNICVISTDDIMELISDHYGMTYNELFDNITYSFAEKMMFKIAKKAFADKVQYIIWDQTNLKVKSRKRKLQMIPKEYQKTAIVFPIPDDHEKRLKSRVGKDIPDDVLRGMINGFEYPTIEEGFDFVRQNNLPL